MNGWILVGEKSVNLNDLNIFVDTFNKMGLPLTKVFANQITPIASNENVVYVNGRQEKLPSFIVSAFFGNNDYHNRSVVKMLESMGVLCINTYACLIDTCDKLKSFQLVREKVKTALLPKTILYHPSLNEAFLTQTIGFPMVIKINHGAKGTGVELAQNYSHLTSIVTNFQYAYDDEILLQEYIAPSRGKDLRIIVCGGEVITSFVRINETAFKSNLATGGHLQFITPPPHLLATAQGIANALSINLGSVDFLLGDDNKYYLCEANSMPGLSYVKASGDDGIKNPLEDVVENIKKQLLVMC
jgi:RimK family alpha-L-glutamate ligase